MIFCHPERSEGSHSRCHPERSEGSHHTVILSEAKDPIKFSTDILNDNSTTTDL